MSLADDVTGDTERVTVGSTVVELPHLTPAAKYFKVLEANAFRVATIEVDGQAVQVPVVDFSRVEPILRTFVGSDVVDAVLADESVKDGELDQLVLRVVARYLTKGDAAGPTEGSSGTPSSED